MAYYFKLPPITDLTIGQQSALNEPGAIAISGGPGTGKSVVSLWRHIRNYATEDKKSLLLTYTKTLESYLSSSAASEARNADNEKEKIRIQNAAENVSRTLWWLSHHPIKYQEIIVDEAQDVSRDNYIILKNFASAISYGADDSQIVFPRNSTTEKQLNQIYSQNKSYLLDENFRNSFQILHFLKGFFSNKLIYQYILEDLKEKKRMGPKPILIKSVTDYGRQIQAIIEIIKLYIPDPSFDNSTHNLAILLPLKKSVESIYSSITNSAINGKKIICSKYYEGLMFEGVSNIHITTFKSSKGLEFDTVIIPEFNKYQHNITHLTLAPITEKDYYVAITRAKRNLYLLTDKVPNYLERSEQQKLTYDIEIL